MNVQPKLLSEPFPVDATDDRTMPASWAEPGHERRLPSGPRAYVTWPVEFEVEPWRP